jgi:hypothetical protein
VIDTTACAALHCDTLLIVNAGTVRLKATGDGGKGINANHNVAVHGGSVQAVATGTREMKKPKGVKIDGGFAIDGGYFYSYSRRSDPLDVAGSLTVAPGYTTYQSEPMQNQGFLLLHSTGNYPAKDEIDVSINYADYYYLEALLRRKAFKDSQ